MLDTLAVLPFWQAFLALFASAMVRSNGTYWVGRGAIAGWRRHRGTHGDLTGRAEAMLRRFGPFGVMRMPLRHYLPAAVAGSTLWAVLYATVGLAVVQAWLAAEAGSWWGVAVVALTLVAVAGIVVRRRRNRSPVPQASAS